MRSGIRALVAVGLTAALLTVACGPGSNNKSSQSGTTGGSTAASAQPPATLVSTGFPTAAEKAQYTQLKSDFDNTILPAAKKEGQVTWYTCLTTEDAQAVITGFNKVYPQISVNYVYMVPNDAFQRVTAEQNAKHVLGDFYSCGGTTSRNLDFAGFVDTYISPSAVDPNASFWFDTVDEDKHDTISYVDLGGLEVNTKLIDKSHYPKSWTDFVQDPYWIDLIKKGQVAIIDPRAPGHGRGLTYGLVRVKADQYGEKWLQTLAALKPKRITVESGEVATGEYSAIAFTTLRQALLDAKAPVALLCPDPGCETTATLVEVLKGAPHPNTARVFADFFLSKAGQDIFASRGETVARTDAKVDDNRSYRTHPPLFWPDDAAAKAGADYQKYVNDSKLFDYP
jgi:iron(III) transport system substrate-binding protein